MDTQATVRHQFAPVAANYTTSAAHAGGPDLEALTVEAALTGAERVLDVGCGTGHTALAVAPRAAAVTAVDLTEAMLEQGRRLAAERGVANITFIAGDAEGLDLPDAAFDLVTSRYSAHHFPHPRQALAEIARVLRPGGRFLLVDVVSPDAPAADTLLNAIELLRDGSHVRDHRVAEWLAMAADAGFAAAVRGSWGLRLGFDAWLARMATPAARAAQIRALQREASQASRETLRIEEDGTFTVPTVLLVGHRP